MIGLILTLAVIGLLVYLIVTFIPMPAPFRTIIIAIAAIVAIIYLIQVLGFDLPLPHAHVR